jgi:hypothetical protein
LITRRVGGTANSGVIAVWSCPFLNDVRLGRIRLWIGADRAIDSSICVEPAPLKASQSTKAHGPLHALLPVSHTHTHLFTLLCLMSSRPSSKFLSRASVSPTIDHFYNLLTATGQTLNPIKPAGAAPSPDNEVSVKEFQESVSKLHPRRPPYAVVNALWLNDSSDSSRRTLRRSTNPQSL